jgi:hypothetical protein
MVSGWTARLARASLFPVEMTMDAALLVKVLRTALLPLLALAGCTTAARIRHEPFDAGTGRVIMAEYEAAVGAVRTSVHQARLRLKLDSTVNNTTSMIVATSASSFFSTGEMVRILTRMAGADRVSVHVLTRRAPTTMTTPVHDYADELFSGIATALIPAAPPGAQEKTPPAERLWSVRVSSGFWLGGPAHGVETAMSAGGFDHAPPCFFIFCLLQPTYPFTWDSGATSVATVDRAVGKNFRIAAEFSRTTFGYTEGYSSNGPPGGTFAAVEPAVNVYTLRAAWVSSGKLRPWFAAGPALFRTSLRSGDSRQFRTLLGASFEMGLQALTIDRFFVEARVQHRMSGSASFRPLSVGGGQSLTASRVNFSHTTPIIGVGIRL